MGDENYNKSFDVDNKNVKNDNHEKDDTNDEQIISTMMIIAMRMSKHLV